MLMDRQIDAAVEVFFIKVIIILSDLINRSVRQLLYRAVVRELTTVRCFSGEMMLLG